MTTSIPIRASSSNHQHHASPLQSPRSNSSYQPQPSSSYRSFGSSSSHQQPAIDESAQSATSAAPASFSPPDKLELDTLALLSQFKKQQSKQEARLARLKAKAEAEEKARQRQKRLEEGAAVASDEEPEGDDDEDEQSFLEAEAWADIERLARVEAGLEDPLEELTLTDSEASDEDEDDDLMSVDDWRALVKEDYQQSQFWYATPFAYRFARGLHAHLGRIRKERSQAGGVDAPPPSIAFLCSPTGYVAFQHLYASSGLSRPSSGREYVPGENLFVMEIDDRFRVAARSGFVKYDYNFPTKGLKDLKGKIDMVVIDPPYLNKPCTDGIATTVGHLLPPLEPSSSEVGPSIFLITGESIAPYACERYPASLVPSGEHVTPMKRTKLVIEHDGARLSNLFGGYANWAGAEDFDGIEAEEE